MKKPVKFGKYYLLERINVGGMAEVFKAKSVGVEGFEKLLAIKRILPSIAEDEDFITMFIDEAKIAVQLNHANIAQIFDLGKIEDSFFIALEFVHGKDLRTIWDRHKRRGLRLPIPLSVYIVSRMCEGLDYAHRKKNASGNDLNIVHRDVSPQNILVSYDGEVKIIDFGIAKAANKASRTQAGILKGKFGYMSPEQVRGLPLDCRSDIFSAGIILYELLTGERLFVGESDFSTLEKVRNVEILPPTTYNRKIPDALEKIALRALSKDPDDRFKAAYDMQEELQRFLIVSKSNFARKDLSAYMKRAFMKDIEREAERHKKYEMMTADMASLETDPAGMPLEPKTGPTTRPRNLPPPIPKEELPPEQIEISMVEDEDDDIQTVVYDARAGFPDKFPTDPIDQLAEAPGSPMAGLPMPAGDPGKQPLAALIGDQDVEMVTSGPPPVSLESEILLPPEEFPTGESTLTEEHPPARRRSRINIIIALLAVVAVGVFGLAVYKYLQRRGYLGSFATLKIVVTPPSAEILLDGRKMSSTIPDVAPGSHLLEAKAANYLPYHEQIQVEPGKDQTITIELSSVPAVVEFTLEPPDAQVWLDGKLRGKKSPVILQDITPGTHSFTFMHPKYESLKKKWEFKPRETMKEKVSLKEKQFSLDVDSTPSGARISLDGTFKGLTPKVIPGLLATREYQLLVKHRSFPAWKGTIFYDDKPVREVRVHLGSKTVKRPSTPTRIETPKDLVKPGVAMPDKKEIPQPTEKPKPQKTPAPVAPETTETGKEKEVVKAAPVPAPKQYGTLRLNSKPWGKVWIDGKDIKRNTPLLDYRLEAGEHTIKIEFSTGESKSEKVTIRPGETTTRLIKGAM